MTKQEILKLLLSRRKRLKRQLNNATPDQWMLISDSIILLEHDIADIRDQIRRAKTPPTRTYTQANAQSLVAMALYDAAAHAVECLKADGHKDDLAWAKVHLQVCWERCAQAITNLKHVRAQVSHVENNTIVIDHTDKPIALP